MAGTAELILYRDLEYGKLFYGFTELIECCSLCMCEKEDMAAKYYDCLHDLIELSARHGFTGNLWHDFLALVLVNNENAYSRSCEMRGEVSGTLAQAARHEFDVFQALVDFDLHKLEEELEVFGIEMIVSYTRTEHEGNMFNRRIRDRICELVRHLEAAEDVGAFQRAVTEFYREYGVGKLGLHKAFRIVHKKNGAKIVPISNIAHVTLEDLIGYEIAKKKLTDNTEAFVSGREANNCLLYGDAGTGKSSSIKAIANRYYDRGLRLIELYKHQFQDLNAVISQIKTRNYKFIIYMDDLSFEDFETEYKYLKAVIEGGLEKKPDNILIYATSNRRHLIREKFSDKAELSDDLHNNDTVQEKLSLAARFGVQIYFGAPDKKEFQTIVASLADRHGICMEQETLLQKANQWEISHGGRSGRTAQQFIDDLLGKEERT